MATFQLGSLITRISGSIGGTTFRRVGSVNVISNKSSGGSRSTLFKNSALFNIRGVLIAWNLISDELKNEWRSTAVLFPVLNKFGAIKTLSGRQFFVKYNSQLTPVAVFNESPDGFDTFIEHWLLKTFVVNTSASSAMVGFGVDDNSIFALIQVIRITSKTATTTFNRRKFVLSQEVTGSMSVNIFEAMVQRFGAVNKDQQYRVIVYGMNKWGVRSPPQTLDAIAT